MIGEFRALGPRGGRSSVLLWIAGEIFIVVAGVLIAFALNAWWAERGARIEEQTHLRALMRDFEENVGVYGELIARAKRTSDASLELLQLARKQPDADPAVVGRMIGPVFSSYRKKPALDAYEALAGSGGLTLIRDEKLRSALAGFADRSSEPYQERFADEVYLAFTTRYVGRMQMAAGVAGDTVQPESFAGLLSDPAFQEHLAYRHVLELNVVSHYEDRLREARDVLEQLRSQLDDSAEAELRE